MKTFFILTLLLIVSARFSPAQADIPAPKPVAVTVSNLAAFPNYKFTYRVNGKNDTKPIPDGRAFSVQNDVQLLVQTGSEAAQVWETVRYDWRGAKVSIVVDGVKQNGQAITVTFKTNSTRTTPGTKSASAIPQTLPLFALTGVGACGLVVLARRRKAA